MSQVILLTGASSGIGYDTAKNLAAAGHTVYGAARRDGKLEELRPIRCGFRFSWTLLTKTPSRRL